MRIIGLLAILTLLNCSKEETVYAPVGSKAEKTELEKSRERAKNVNEVERRLIQEWMKNQKEKFFPTPLNYWINRESFDQRTSNPGDLRVTYSYMISDFEGNAAYKTPKGFREIPLNKVTDVKAVQNALQKMHEGEEVKLLVPSELAFGTSGDGGVISADIPLIINLKIIKFHDQ